MVIFYLRRLPFASAVAEEWPDLRVLEDNEGSQLDGMLYSRPESAA